MKLHNSKHVQLIVAKFYNLKNNISKHLKKKSFNDFGSSILNYVYLLGSIIEFC